MAMMKKMKTTAFLSAILLSMLFVSTGCTGIVPEGTSDAWKDSEISIGTTTESSATNDENTIGTTELTSAEDAEQWETKAKSLYDAACDMYFGIVSTEAIFKKMRIQVVYSIRAFTRCLMKASRRLRM